MVILITGHKGYIGSSLVPYIRRKIKKAYIIGLDTNYFDYPNSKDVDLEINEDLRKSSLADIKKIDAVVNLSAIYKKIAKIIVVHAIISMSLK